MEVHHHSHTSTPDSHRGRKKWTHYFWEFLMLFLAVFCGFLAEYQLEHTIENQRERNYIRSLLAETKQDIIEYDSLLKRIDFIDPVADSLYYNVKSAEKYSYNLLGKWNSHFNSIGLHYYPALTTIQQLKHSGNLRLIKDQQLQQQIIFYEISVMGNLLRSRTGLLESLKSAFNLQNEFCDLSNFNESITASNRHSQLNGKTPKDPMFEMPIITRDPHQLNRLANSFVDFRGYLFFYRIDINKIKANAIKLADMISVKYNLK